MKKALAFMLLCSCPTVHPLDWKLPVFTVKYEVSRATIEDPDPDEDILVPSALRNTVSFRVKESARPLALGLTVKYSAKDYLTQSGDYEYFSVEQDTGIALTDWLDLGLKLGVKKTASPEPDTSGLSKDNLALKGGIETVMTFVRGTSLALEFQTEYDSYEAWEKSRRLYCVGAGFSTRLGEWLFSTRYRGEFRFPLASSSVVDRSTLNTGSLSFQWDPNR
jgi:hypothetical protein